MNLRRAELLGELLEGFPGLEPLENILHPTSASCEDGSTGRSGRIYDNLGRPVGGYSEELDVAIRAYRKPRRYASISSGNTHFAVTYHRQPSHRAGGFHIGITLRIPSSLVKATGR